MIAPRMTSEGVDDLLNLFSEQCDRADRYAREADALERWKGDAMEELADIRSQYGDDAIWLKHHEPVVKVLLGESP